MINMMIYEAVRNISAPLRLCASQPSYSMASVWSGMSMKNLAPF